MRHVIIRDDDTNAFTPPECLEQLYRPFLERAMPVNLAVIPAVRRDAKTPEGKREEFLFAANGTAKETNPIGDSSKLVAYLRSEPGYRVVQHGCHHDTFEFGTEDAKEIARRITEGTRYLAEAGFDRPITFVAPHDRFSRAAFRASAEYFRIISTGWFELARLPHPWWPKYAVKKLRKRPHWRAGNALLLSHPGCLLSRFRQRDKILDEVKSAIATSPVTVLVTHWWEYFPDGKPDREFIAVLHEVADYLAAERDIKVIAFDDLLTGR
jgi:uncharacterized protein DUF2334